MHTPRFSFVKHRALIQCECGWAGGKHKTSDAALERWRQHVADEMERERRLLREQTR